LRTNKNGLRKLAKLLRFARISQTFNYKKMRRLFFLSISIFCLTIFFQPATLVAQGEEEAKPKTVSKKEVNIWKTLGKITFRKQYDELMGFKVDMPVFSDGVKNLDGKEITVRGYIIPTEGYKSHKEFVFSAFPYNMCFFCGGAGPETVMEVEAKEGIEFQAEAVTIKGILHLNDSDINRLIYSLTDVILVE